MDTHLSNPAGRLWLYFTELWNYPEHEAAQPYAAGYFGLPAATTPEFLRQMGGLMALPTEVEVAVWRLDDPFIPAAKLLSPLESVQSVLRTDPLAQQAIGWYKQHINPTVLSELETTSHVLSRSRDADAIISDDTIAMIRSLAEQIIQLALDDEDMDEDSKSIFIRFGHRIQEAADLYKTRGTLPLVDEIDRFTQEYRRAGTKPGKVLVGKIKELIGTVVVATELFTAPVNIQAALEFYAPMFQLEQITEAPGVFDQAPVEAVLIEDET